MSNDVNTIITEMLHEIVKAHFDIPTYIRQEIEKNISKGELYKAIDIYGKAVDDMADLKHSEQAKQDEIKTWEKSRGLKLNY